MGLLPIIVIVLIIVAIVEQNKKKNQGGSLQQSETVGTLFNPQERSARVIVDDPDEDDPDEDDPDEDDPDEYDPDEDDPDEHVPVDRDSNENCFTSKYYNFAANGDFVTDEPTEEDLEINEELAQDGEHFIYCSVSFEDSDRTYYYLTDNCKIRRGAFVAVPFGRNNEIKYGRVVCVDIHTRETAPFPVEKTKYIVASL